MIQVHLTDTALAKIVAQTAVDVPGVARLAPGLAQRLKGVALRAARQLTDAPVDQPRPADPGAVDIDYDDDRLSATVRLVAAGAPPVIDTVTAAHREVTAALAAVGRSVTSVIVIVVDTDPS